MSDDCLLVDDVGLLHSVGLTEVDVLVLTIDEVELVMSTALAVIEVELVISAALAEVGLVISTA